MHEGHRDRMRDRLLSADESLTDCELLEILLYDCIDRKNTNPIAHLLLDSFIDLKGVFNASPRLLRMVAGIGPRTAEHIWLYGRLFHKIYGLQGGIRPNMRNFGTVREFVKERFAGVLEEKAELYLLDRDGFLLCCKTIWSIENSKTLFESKALGALFGEVHPRGVVFAHNHPSGDSSPSAEDDRSMVELFEMCGLHGVSLYDSVIMAGDELFSYYCADRMRTLGLRS